MSGKRLRLRKQENSISKVTATSGQWRMMPTRLAHNRLFVLIYSLCSLPGTSLLRTLNTTRVDYWVVKDFIAFSVKVIEIGPFIAIKGKNKRVLRLVYEDIFIIKRNWNTQVSVSSKEVYIQLCGGWAKISRLKNAPVHQTKDTRLNSTLIFPLPFKNSFKRRRNVLEACLWEST